MHEVWRKLEDGYPGKSYADRLRMFMNEIVLEKNIDVSPLLSFEGHGGTAPLWVGWATTLP